MGLGDMVFKGFHGGQDLKGVLLFRTAKHIHTGLQNPMGIFYPRVKAVSCWLHPYGTGLAMPLSAMFLCCHEPAFKTWNQTIGHFLF